MPFISDTFTEASTVSLTAHTPEIGSAWALQSGLTTAINVLNTGIASSGVSAQSGARNTAVPPSADYRVTTTVRVGSVGSGVYAGPIARAYAAAQTYYQAFIGDTVLLLAKVVGGSFTTLGTTPVTLVANTDYTVSITVIGSQISAAVNSTTLGPFTDTAITAAGFAGFVMAGTGSVISDIVDNTTIATYTYTAPLDGTVRQLSGGATGTVSIPVTGTYTGAVPTQARLVLDGTNTPVSGFDWATIGSASGGNFSHTFSAVPKGGWYNVQVRDTGSGFSQASGKVGAGVVVAVDGQSNAVLWFSTTSTAGDSTLVPSALTRITGKQPSNLWVTPATATMNAAIACANDLATTLACPVALVDGAYDGSGLTITAGGGQWVNSGGTAGNAYTSSAAALTAAGGKAAATVWIQGEADANNAVTEAAYYTALGQLITLRRSAVSDSSHPYVVVGLASNTTGTITDANWEAIKRAQLSKQQDTNVFRVYRLDLPLQDGTHHNATGYTSLGKRCAQAVLAALGVVTSYRGPRIASVAMFNATTFDVNLTFSGTATAFTPASGITGFRVLDGSTPITVSSAVQQTSTRVRLTLASAPSALPTIQYLYGVAPVITGIVKDNSTLAMPLEYNIGVVAIPATATVVSLTLTTDGTAPAVSLSGLKWAYFDQLPGAFAAPIAQGTIESTDASGLLVLDIPNSSLAVGATGWLIVTSSDGTVGQSPSAKAFSGPVVVS